MAVQKVAIENIRRSWIHVCRLQISPCPSSLTVHPLRLEPGAELKSSLMRYVNCDIIAARCSIT